MDWLRRNSFWIVLSVLWIALAVVVVTLLLPQVKANRDIEDEIRKGQEFMESWLTPERQKQLPNKDIINAYQDYKDYLSLQWQATLEYLAARDTDLERKLPGEERMGGQGQPSPLIFKGAYVAAVRQLRERMHKYGVDKKLSEERWESNADEHPDPFEYEWLRKRLWIWQDLCWAIETTRMAKDSVLTLQVRRFEVPPDVLTVGRQPLYKVSKVTFVAQIPFYKLGMFLDYLLYPNSRKPGRTSVVIKAMRIEKAVIGSSARGGAVGEMPVQVSLDLEYLDFNVPESG